MLFLFHSHQLFLPCQKKKTEQLTNLDLAPRASHGTLASFEERFLHPEDSPVPRFGCTRVNLKQERASDLVGTKTSGGLLKQTGCLRSCAAVRAAAGCEHV